MKPQMQKSSDDEAATRHAATTAYDVIKTQTLLEQLAGNSGAIHRKQYIPMHVRWARSIAGWLRRDRSA